MKIMLGIILAFSFDAFAARKMMAMQAYELYGGLPTADGSSHGSVFATISILNVSNIEQTVRWDAQFISNRPLNSNKPDKCSYHGVFNPIINKAEDLGGFAARLKPGGYVTLACHAYAKGISNAPDNNAGGEGVLRMEFTVDEDRGAITASGSLHIQDRGIASDSGTKGWGDTGGGPFLINGGRAF